MNRRTFLALAAMAACVRDAFASEKPAVATVSPAFEVPEEPAVFCDRDGAIRHVGPAPLLGRTVVVNFMVSDGFISPEFQRTKLGYRMPDGELRRVYSHCSNETFPPVFPMSAYADLPKVDYTLVFLSKADVDALSK